MKAVRQMHNLDELSISGTSVSDEGIKELDSLSKLKLMTASFCPNISARGVLEFKAAHHGLVMLTHYNN